MLVAQDRQLGAVGAGGLGEFVGQVVREGRDPSVSVLVDGLAELVTVERHHLAERVSAGGEAACRVVRVGEGAVVEVGLGCQPPGRIVGVTPGHPLRVGDLGETQFGVVLEGVADTVGGGAGGEQVEVCVLETGDLADGIGVADAIALAVEGPRLGGAVRRGVARQVSFHGPRQAGDRPGGVGDRDRAAEGVTGVRGRGAERVGDLDREPRSVAADKGGVAQCVGDRCETACIVVGETRGPTVGPDDGGLVAALVVRLPVGGAVCARHLHREAVAVVRGSALRPSGRTTVTRLPSAS